MGNKPDLILFTGVLCIALLLAMALRHPLRRCFGARVAYLVWGLVPALLLSALLAALLPEQVRQQVILIDMTSLPDLPLPAVTPQAHDWTALLASIWLVGALLMAAGFWRHYRRFVLGLGTLSERHGVLHSETLAASAVSLGLWRPQIVVPHDFAQRYTPLEQDLIVRHERVHARRGDAWANLLQALLQCAFWFNPLVHAAALRFRFDQELACDAIVVAGHPGAIRDYARALLKSPLTAPGPTLACHWHAIHPIKERIMHLQHKPPTTRRRIGGTLVVASLLLAAAVAGLSGPANAQAGGADYAVNTTVRFAGQATSPRVRVHAGEPFSIRSDVNGKRWAAKFQIEQQHGTTDSVWIRGNIEAEGATLAKPVLLSRLGEPARISIGTAEGPFEVSIMVAALKK